MSYLKTADELALNFVHKPWSWADSRDNLIQWNTPLMTLSPFRKALVEALRSRKPVGKMTITDEGGSLAFHGDDGENAERFWKNAALAGQLPLGSKLEVRICDLVAYHLTPKHGAEVWAMPAFRLDDPLERRDGAIADWIQLLDRKGE